MSRQPGEPEPPGEPARPGEPAPPGEPVPQGWSRRARGRRQFVHCPACEQWTAPPTCEWCGLDLSDHQEVAEAVRAAQRPPVWVHSRRRGYSALRALGRFDVREQAALVVYLLRWVVLGCLVGVLAGMGSAAFLESLDLVTRIRQERPALLFGLPLAGLVIGLAYHYGAAGSAAGNNLILDEIHEPRGWVPRRMAPLVFAGTIVTHLFGGSAGREGTAIQMAGSLTDGANRVLRLQPGDRRIMLIAAIAGGFGSVFGVPLAGAVFALEVQAVGRLRYDALIPAITASIMGDAVVRAIGVPHLPIPLMPEVDVTAPLLAKVALAGVAFGLAGIVFAELTQGIRLVAATLIRWPPARPVIGGLVIISLTWLFDTRDYLGLSLPLIEQALAGGAGLALGAFAAKLLFTAVTLGTGFQGGEVTPLFVIGATLGATLGALLDVPPEVMAAVGFVAVFAGATNTPLACTVMGVELFGAGMAVPLVVACVVSYIFSSNRGIYSAQRVDTPKGAPLAGSAADGSVVLRDLGSARAMWLPRTWRRERSDPPETE